MLRSCTTGKDDQLLVYRQIALRKSLQSWFLTGLCLFCWNYRLHSMLRNVNCKFWNVFRFFFKASYAGLHLAGRQDQAMQLNVTEVRFFQVAPKAYFHRTCQYKEGFVTTVELRSIKSTWCLYENYSVLAVVGLRVGFIQNAVPQPSCVLRLCVKTHTANNKKR